MSLHWMIYQIRTRNFFFSSVNCSKLNHEHIHLSFSFSFFFFGWEHSYRLYPTNISGLNVHIQATIYNPSFANVTDMGIVRFDMAYASTTHTTFDTNGLSLGHLLTDGPLSVVPGKELFIFFLFFFYFFFIFFLLLISDLSDLRWSCNIFQFPLLYYFLRLESFACLWSLCGPRTGCRQINSKVFSWWIKCSSCCCTQRSCVQWSTL